MPTTELVRREPTAMELLQSAVDKGAGIETVERLVALQRDMREYEAKVAFDGALHQCQKQMTLIGADLYNPQTKSKYASYAKLDKVLRPIYSAQGFSLSFDTEPSANPDSVLMVCYVSREGHTRTYHLPMPADGKGAKGGDVMTKTHATGAATAYGMRYLLKMIFNVAVGEEDNDGNGGPMEETEQLSWAASMEGAIDKPSLVKYFNAAFQEAQKRRDNASLQYFRQVRDKRQGELDASH
jgi:ERF superfamily protein